MAEYERTKEKLQEVEKDLNLIKKNNESVLVYPKIYRPKFIDFRTMKTKYRFSNRNMINI